MSELVSAYPTSGGIYWWASKMGGPAAGFFTGWLNLIGLLAVTASVAYGAATFFDLTLSTLSSGYADSYSLTRVFIMFVVILALAATANIFSGHLLAIVNNISVWWHVAGAAIVILILIVVPDTHQSVGFVFTERINNSGLQQRRSTGSWCCRSASCSRSTRSPASTPRPTCRRRPRARPTAPPRASGARSSTRRSAATSCCSPSSSRFRTRTR